MNPLRAAAPSVELEKEIPVVVEASDDASAQKPQGDMADMLARIKLPGRKEVMPGAPQRAPAPAAKMYDTALGAMIPPRAPEKRSEPRFVNTSLSAETLPISRAPSEEQKKSLTSVHTLRDDLQHVVRDQKMSLVKAVALEEERKQKKESPAPVAPSKRNLGMAFGALFTVIVLTAGGYGAYLIWDVRSQSIPDSGPSLMYAETTVELPVGTRSGADLKRLMSEGRRERAPLGSITRIVPTISDEPGLATKERESTISELLERIEATAPDELARALRGDFFFGFHAADTMTPVFVIPVLAFERAFGAMLEWEGSLNPDLAPIFNPVPIQRLDQNGLLTTRKFEDAVIRNYDVRVLLNDDGTIALYYSFPTRDILVIGESPSSFIEVLSRLRANRQL